jgi:hypothetical protein
MVSSGAVSSAGESPSASAPDHMLTAGVLVDADSLARLSDIKLEEAPASGLDLKKLASDANEFLTSIAPTLKSAPAVQRALQLYLEQRLTSYGLRRSVVVARAIVRT